MTHLPDEPFCVIDAQEFQEALESPEHAALMERVTEHKEDLINRGHCSQCLIVNCEHVCYIGRRNPIGVEHYGESFGVSSFIARDGRKS